MRRAAFLLAALSFLPATAVAAPDVEQHSLSWFVHVDLVDPNDPNANLAFWQGFLDARLADDADRLVQGSEGPVDTPCCSSLLATSVSTFGSNGDGLNVIENGTESDAVFALGAGAYLVQSVFHCAGTTSTSIRGCATISGDHMQVALDAEDTDVFGLVAAHERGHNAGLVHVTSNECELMRSAAGGGCLSVSECTSYRTKGDTLVGTCECHDDTVGNPPSPDGTLCGSGSVCAGALCPASPGGLAGIDLYVTAGTGALSGDPADELLAMNALTGGWTSIGTVTVSASPVEVTGLAYAARTDTLYGVSPQAAANDRLLAIDRSDGTATVVGTLDRDGILGLAWDPNRGTTGALIGSEVFPFASDPNFDETRFVEIDPNGASVSVIGSSQFLFVGGFEGLAFDAQSGTLYGSTTNGLRTIDLGSCSPFCPSQAVDPSNSLVGASALGFDPGTGLVFGVNPAVLRLEVALGSQHPGTLAYQDKVVDGFTPGGLAVIPDTDQDGVADDGDNCVSVVNTDQSDTDTATAAGSGLPAAPDGVGDVCDNCTVVANPRIAPLAFQATTGGQLDDDTDGFGNHCDADFNNVDNLINPSDLALFLAANGKKRSKESACSGGPCDIYDINGADNLINPADLTRFLQLNGTKKNKKQWVTCSACPLP